MLSLGQALVHRPNIRVIGTPTSESVRDALVIHPSADRCPAHVAAAISMTELKAALDGAMIETRYQPIIRISDREPVGLEALARLNHPVRGTIPPDQFVPQIENAGLSEELTRIVSHRAFADLSGPLLRGRDLSVAVNFPLDLLETPAAPLLLEEQRHAFGIPAERIIVELTESRPVTDIPALCRALERLRGLGYGVAIDDVTPGMPGVDALIDLPFTCLKFDKDIMQETLRSPEMYTFVARKTAAAKQRGLYVVAEGIETEELWDKAAGIGADAVQGFLVARPLPVAAIPIWWESWQQDALAA
ncbi:MAG TPA: EAL domain-containing protein [Rhodopila sp.]|uniref:EAL domain-containing protein n=1 Tax=Rhodopila sp. TaxID=2480087 RepID=UPI002C568712|nr:EAL domain-containing protein [Rhodopila sp.]HVY14789.1 EAL domain-containing protein [Rhodopila sp.]